MTLNVAAVPLGPIQTNCYVVWRDGTSQAVVVDPGGDAEQLLTVLRERELAVDAVLVTHCHWDHIGAVAAIARAHACPVYMSQIEAHVLADIDSYAPAQFGPYESHQVDVELSGDEQFELAGITFRTMHLPGHSPGSLGFLVQEADRSILFVGDLIFAGSVGRTDLPFADHDTLLHSAERVLRECDDETLLLSGHGPATTVGQERTSNPFLAPLAVTR